MSWFKWKNNNWIEMNSKTTERFREVKEIMKEKRAMARQDHEDLKGAYGPADYIKVSQETKSEPGKRYDVGKLRYDLIPVDALKELALVYSKGAEKYADRNWEKGMSWSRVIGPLMRHLEAFRRGEIIDQETGCRHMAQVAWNALALVSYEMRHIGTNDLGWEHYPERVNKISQQEILPNDKSTKKNS